MAFSDSKKACQDVLDACKAMAEEMGSKKDSDDDDDDDKDDDTPLVQKKRTLPEGTLPEMFAKKNRSEGAAGPEADAAPLPAGNRRSAMLLSAGLTGAHPAAFQTAAADVPAKAKGAAPKKKAAAAERAAAKKKAKGKSEAAEAPAGGKGQGRGRGRGRSGRWCALKKPVPNDAAADAAEVTEGDAD